MKSMEERQRKLERIKKQCPPKSYRLQNAVVTKPTTEIYTPTRQEMKAKIKLDATQNPEVQKAMKELPTRKEKHGYLRRVINSAIANLRGQMTEEMNKFNQQRETAEAKSDR